MIAYSLLDSINKIIKLTSWHVKYQTLALSIVRFQFEFVLSFRVLDLTLTIRYSFGSSQHVYT